MRMKISKVITERGYTIAQVAEKLGKSRISVAKTITNNPTVETLRKIAEVIGCNITDFFADEEPVQTMEPDKLTCPHCGQPIEVCLAKPQPVKG